MIINRVIVGSLEENCYILKKDNSALIIDPGADYEKIKSSIGSNKVEAILITHNHFDHVGALTSFKEKEYSFNNLKEKEYRLGPFTFNVIYTPGHSNDSISFYFKEENCLFCGDFIFYHNIGRCDLPSGNYNAMQKSIQKIKKYPPKMQIYPGHGNKTTLEEEIINNYYFNK